MPKGVVTIEVEASCEEVFDLIHDYTRRLEWDSLLSSAAILGGVKAAGIGVHTLCVGTWRSARIPMETEYVNFQRGEVAAVKLINRPLLFDRFAATIRHEPLPDGRSSVTYIYSFHARPRWLAFALEPLLNIALRRETKARLESLKRYIEGQTGCASKDAVEESTRAGHAG